jgi:hypothetical protein
MLLWPGLRLGRLWQPDPARRPSTRRPGFEVLEEHSSPTGISAGAFLGVEAAALAIAAANQTNAGKHVTFDLNVPPPIQIIHTPAVAPAPNSGGGNQWHHALRVHRGSFRSECADRDG